MEWIIVAIGFILIFIGFIGCLLPVLPGPPLSYIGMLMLQLTNPPYFTSDTMIKWLLITIAVTALDYIIPIIGTKTYGGSNKGVWGSAIGLILGLIFFPPLGIIIGPFIGAMVGEFLAGKKSDVAFKSAIGSFVGLMVSTVFKLIASGWMAYLYIDAII